MISSSSFVPSSFMYICRYAYRQTVVAVFVSFFRFFSCYGFLSFSLYVLGVFRSLVVSLFRYVVISLGFVSFVRSFVRPCVRSFVLSLCRYVFVPLVRP